MNRWCFPFLASPVLVLFLSSVSFAGGMAVADALQHMYSSMNLEKTVQQLETGIQQLELVQKYTDTIEKTYDKAHKNYKRAKDVYDDLMAVKAFYDKTKTTWMGRYERYRGLYDAVSNPEKAIEEFEDLLDDAFVDPRNMDPKKWKQFIDRQFDLRQLALKDVLTRAEQTTSDMGKRVEKAQELAKNIDETGSEKDAMDLNNRLLLEILLVLQDALAMDAQFQQSMASLKYEGVTEDSIKTRQEKVSEVEARIAEYKSLEDQLVEQLGVSDQDTIMDTFEKTMNQGI